MTATTYELECGCGVDVDHTCGERLVFCPCHGIRYAVRAEEISSVLYSSRRLDPVEEDEDLKAFVRGLNWEAFQ